MEESFDYRVGTRIDSFFHINIVDPLWARTILPKACVEQGSSIDALRITRGNAEFPDINCGGEYVKYFENLDVESVTGSRESGSIQLNLKSGISFEMRFTPGMRRRFELWVHGLSGTPSSRQILSAASGLEFSL